jgi:hypothetical protein
MWINKYHRIEIWIIEKGHSFGVPEEGFCRKGPCVVIKEVNIPNGRTGTVKCKGYEWSDPALWERLSPWLRAGMWAFLSKEIAPLLPDDLVELSPRFNGTSKKQRQRMAEKLPNKRRQSK